MLSDSRWGRRITGEGETAEAIHSLFRITAGRLGLNGGRMVFDTSAFRKVSGTQRELFG